MKYISNNVLITSLNCKKGLTKIGLSAIVDISFYENKKAKNTFTIYRTDVEVDGNSATTQIREQNDYL